MFSLNRDRATQVWRIVLADWPGVSRHDVLQVLTDYWGDDGQRRLLDRGEPGDLADRAIVRLWAREHLPPPMPSAFRRLIVMREERAARCLSAEWDEEGELVEFAAAGMDLGALDDAARRRRGRGR